MHKTAVCTETHRQSYPEGGRKECTILMGMLAYGRNGSAEVSLILPSSSVLNLSPGLARLPVALCVKFRLLHRQHSVKLCPIKTDLAEVLVTRGLLGINILSVVLK